jgi:hypothetical protein
MPDEMTEYKIERPACGHMQIVKARKHQNLADYNTRLVPELRDKLNSVECEECEKERAELVKQKLQENAKK